MPMQPTLRLKKRYCTFKVDSPVQFTPHELDIAVQDALLRFLGEFGIARAGPIFLKERCRSNVFVLKVNHHSVEVVRCALILIKKIKNTPVIVHSVTTSGTLKKAVERSTTNEVA